MTTLGPYALNTIITGDALSILRTLPDRAVQCVVTSPPYWGLRDYGVDGQLGSETVPDCLGWATKQPCGECYICHMVAVFREVWRVLRDDGTLWLNMGDSYVGSGKARGTGGTGYSSNKQKTNRGSYFQQVVSLTPDGYKPKDLMMMPARLALALQADGWYLRSDIIWSKRNPMPESVTDRPTTSHEHIFLLAKQPRYYYDADAVAEPCSPSTHARISQDLANQVGTYRANGGNKTNGPLRAVVKGSTRKLAEAGSGIKNNGSMESALSLMVDKRNRRSVWDITTEAFKGAHFAVFPTAIPEICIKAGTSEAGECPECGRPWPREVERPAGPRTGTSETAYPTGSSAHRLALLRQTYRENGQEYSNQRVTVGWQPGCDCGKEPVPQTVLDPFCGAGTTCLVANRLGRSYIGIELNPAYVAMARNRVYMDAPLFNMEAIE